MLLASGPRIAGAVVATDALRKLRAHPPEFGEDASCCLGITTREGLVSASDSRTSAGYDDVNLCRKMHKFVVPGERVFILMCSGSLSLSQSVLTLLNRDFSLGIGLAKAATMSVPEPDVPRMATQSRGHGAQHVPCLLRHFARYFGF
jgi:hypothetical protein